MPDEYTIVRDRQKLIRREMDRRGITVTAVQYDGGWEHPSTVLSYFPANKDKEPAAMPVAALYRLIEHEALPTELLSLLLPGEYMILRKPDGINHEEIVKLIQDYLATKMAAHHPESECGPAIGPGEHDQLTTKFALIAGGKQ